MPRGDQQAHSRGSGLFLTLVLSEENFVLDLTGLLRVGVLGVRQDLVLPGLPMHHTRTYHVHTKAESRGRRLSRAALGWAG